MPDCALLFSEPDQQVHHLNVSGAAVASLLQREATWDQLATELRERGVGAETAENWIAAALDQLADAALLEARPAGNGAATSRTVLIRVAGVHFALEASSNDIFDQICGAYACLETDAATAQDHTYHLAEAGEFVLIGKDRGAPRAFRRSTAAVRLKGAILDDVLTAHDDAAALHAACVLRKDAAFLLLGPPGTGKTTVSLALSHQGFGFGSDDVTLVLPGGKLRTIPLPAAVKESAWETVERLGVRLSGLPVHCRPDGQRVRFYPIPEARLDSPMHIGAIIRLRRNPGSDTALQPIAREQALAALFEESRSLTGRCSTAIMQAFAQLVREAECLDLHYSEAADAAALLAEYSQ